MLVVFNTQATYVHVQQSHESTDYQDKCDAQRGTKEMIILPQGKISRN